MKRGDGSGKGFDSHRPDLSRRENQKEKIKPRRKGISALVSTSLTKRKIKRHDIINILLK